MGVSALVDALIVVTSVGCVESGYAMILSVLGDLLLGFVRVGEGDLAGGGTGVDAIVEGGGRATPFPFFLRECEPELK